MNLTLSNRLVADFLSNHFGLVHKLKLIADIVTDTHAVSSQIDRNWKLQMKQKPEAINQIL